MNISTGLKSFTFSTFLKFFPNLKKEYEALTNYFEKSASLGHTQRALNTFIVFTPRRSGHAMLRHRRDTGETQERHRCQMLSKLPGLILIVTLWTRGVIVRRKILIFVVLSSQPDSFQLAYLKAYL